MRRIGRPPEFPDDHLERAGEPGWPETPSASDPAEIPAAILANNLFGIDIDLRAVQLSALALYLKARSWQPAGGQRNTQHAIRANLACADVRPLDGYLGMDGVGEHVVTYT